MLPAPPPLAWLAPGEDFPPVTQSWGADSPAPGLLAAGGALDTETLCRAYGQGVFPWFSEGQPILHAVLQELECFWRNLWDASDKV